MNNLLNKHENDSSEELFNTIIEDMDLDKC